MALNRWAKHGIYNLNPSPIRGHVKSSSRKPSKLSKLIAACPKSPYQEYLQSEHWRTLRAETIASAKFACELCGTKQPPINVHHKSYSRLGCERREDLQVLCRDCHKKLHNIPVASSVPVTRTSTHPGGHVEAEGTRVSRGCHSSLNSGYPFDEGATQAPPPTQ